MNIARAPESLLRANAIGLLFRRFVEADRCALRVRDDRDAAYLADGHHRDAGFSAKLVCLGKGRVNVLHDDIGNPLGWHFGVHGLHHAADAH